VASPLLQGSGCPKYFDAGRTNFADQDQPSLPLTPKVRFSSDYVEKVGACAGMGSLIQSCRGLSIMMGDRQAEQAALFYEFFR
jgi:hypothetical protein